MLNRYLIIPILGAALLAPLISPAGTALAGEAQPASVDRQIRDQGARALGQLSRQLVHADWQRRAVSHLSTVLGHRNLAAATPGADTKSRN